MKLKQKLASAKWIKILVFYSLACLLTFAFTKFPNFIKKLWVSVFNLDAPFNYNHGIGLLLATLLCYFIFKSSYRTSFLGTKPAKSLLIAALYLIFYSLFGLSNNLEINEHLWGLIFCSSMLIYNIFEETAWRGFLQDSLAEVPLWLKGIVTGVLWGVWHIFIFENFDQFGGLQNFVMLTVVLSIIMAYAVHKTNSILVAASIHGLMILRNNYVTIICLVIWTLLIITWEWDRFMIKRKTAYTRD